MPLQDTDADFLTGRLLVAMPGIDDPRFERAVLYVCAHNDEHAMGLAVNRPVEGLTVPDLLERLGVQSNIRMPPELVLMGQDIAEYGGVFKVTAGLSEAFGKNRVRNTPLCESAIVGIGLGLSVNG